MIKKLCVFVLLCVMFVSGTVCYARHSSYELQDLKIRAEKCLNHEFSEHVMHCSTLCTKNEMDDFTDTSICKRYLKLKELDIYKQRG